MRTNRLTILMVAALAAFAGPASASSDDAFGARLRAAEAAVAVTEAAKVIARISGIYHQEIRRDGEVLLADDLEIAPFAEGAISFKVSRQSYEGGHASCELSGVARYRGGRFLFTDNNDPILGARRCVMEIRLGARGLELADGGACQDYCGAAMTLDRAQFRYHGR